MPELRGGVPETIGSDQAFEDWKQEIRALLGEGQKIQAIKVYREAHWGGAKTSQGSRGGDRAG